MDELQISLLGIGAATVLALYAYNWLQQRRYKRKFGEVFKRGHDDALYRMPNPGADEGASEEHETKAGSHLAPGDLRRTKPGDDELCLLMESSWDYIVKMTPKALSGADVLARLWQQRFDFGRNLNVCGLNVASGAWERLIPESKLPYAGFKLALQLVNRNGAVSQAKLQDFHDLVQVIAIQLEAEAAFPDIAEFSLRAQELDRFCASVDQLIGLNIMPGADCLLSGGEISRTVSQHGFNLQTDGSFHLMDERGHTLFSLGNFDNSPFQHHTLEMLRVRGLTLLLDVPRVDKPVARFDEMVALAKQLAADLDAAMVDDHYTALSEGGIELIRNRISAIESSMLEGHIVPGSSQARRLFS